LAEKEGMPRIARIQAPYCVHHLIVRFVNGENRFDNLPGARQEFLRRVGLTLKKVDWIFLAFALMGNHGHLVFLAGIDPPSKVMRPLGSGFAGWWNCQMRKRGYPYNRTRGPVFADRFADVIVPPERTAIVVAYVHNNSVRARLVVSPEMSDWTSHRAFLGLDISLPYLNTKLALKLCGLDDTARGRTEFHDFV
jgi:putative transposase